MHILHLLGLLNSPAPLVIICAACEGSGWVLACLHLILFGDNLCGFFLQLSQNSLNKEERERERERMVEGEEPVYVRMYVYINLVCVTTLYIPSSTHIFSVWRNEFVYVEYGSAIAVSSSSLLIHSFTHLSILTVLLSPHSSNCTEHVPQYRWRSEYAKKERK